MTAKYNNIINNIVKTNKEVKEELLRSYLQSSWKKSQSSR